MRAPEQLVRDQADDDGNDESCAAGDDLQQAVAEMNPPPEKGRRVGSVVSSALTVGAILPYEWIFAICFLSNLTTPAGIGTKRIDGP